MNPQRLRVCGCTDCSAFFAQGNRVEPLEAEDFSGKKAIASASTEIVLPHTLSEHERHTNTSTGAS